MTYRNATKLHNRDEITLKETGEVGYVLSASPGNGQLKQITIEAVFPQTGHRQVGHRDVT